MKKTILIVLILLLTILQTIRAQAFLDEGLYFSSHEVTKEERTSLNLTPNSPIGLNKKLTIEFDANFRRGDGFFGNIVKIIGDKRLNIEIVANLISEEENFWLTVQDQVVIRYKWADVPQGNYGQWAKFKLEIDTEKSELSMTVNGNKIIKQSTAIKGLKNLEIIFGKSIYTNFSTTDVCPMSVRNITIFNAEGKRIRNWTLGKHTMNDKVYDELINDEAIVQNPTWLIDQHIFWKKSKRFKFHNVLGMARDTQSERVFIVESDAVKVYSIRADSLASFAFKAGSLKCQSNEFIFNEFTKELIVYSLDKKFHATFNFKTRVWTDTDQFCNETNFLHHTKMISPLDSGLLTFGGYGQYKYRSEIINFDKESVKFNATDLSNRIMPRYLSSSGILDQNTFLIFGGNGSNSGKQGVNSQFYYDLYSVRFDGLKVKKMWDTNKLADRSFVPVRSMVVDTNSNSFYTLVYDNANFNTNLKLVRFGINSSEMTIYPDSIPYQFLDIKSDADFFLNADKTKLYALTLSENELTILSLTYPPLVAAEIYQEDKATTFWDTYRWPLIIACCLVLTYGIIMFRNRSRSKPENDGSSQEIIELMLSKSNKVKVSAIYLFGGLQVYDAEGNDITAQFTPTIKELFLIVLLSSIKNDKRVSSNKLTEVLWPNKSESNARNNKNVNISKLRILLDKIGDVTISNKNTYWQIVIGESVYCDYKEVVKISDESLQKNLDKERVYELLRIVSRGKLSPDTQTEWVQDFQDELSNTLVDDLDRISKIQGDQHLQIVISKAILYFDPLNEEAIALKCKSLYALGKKRLAKENFNEFCREYKEVLNAKYDKSFDEIIS